MTNKTRYECGCEITVPVEPVPGGTTLKYCSLHDAAPELLKACIKAFKFVSDEHNNEIIIKEEMPGAFGLWNDLSEAIAKAKGETR